MSEDIQSLNAVIWQVRRLFQRLASESNELLAGYGINVTHRGLLEILHNVEPETVPNIAKNYDVSRQHIQKVVNEMVNKGLLETVDNPAHKRSVLIQRTAKGSALLGDVKAMENELYADMLGHLDAKALKQSSETLSEFNIFMHSPAWQSIKKNHLK